MLGTSFASAAGRVAERPVHRPATSPPQAREGRSPPARGLGGAHHAPRVPPSGGPPPRRGPACGRRRSPSALPPAPTSARPQGRNRAACVPAPGLPPPDPRSPLARLPGLCGRALLASTPGRPASAPPHPLRTVPPPPHRRALARTAHAGRRGIQGPLAARARPAHSAQHGARPLAHAPPRCARPAHHRHLTRPLSPGPAPPLWGVACSTTAIAVRALSVSSRCSDWLLEHLLTALLCRPRCAPAQCMGAGGLRAPAEIFSWFWHRCGSSGIAAEVLAAVMTEGT